MRLERVHKWDSPKAKKIHQTITVIINLKLKGIFLFSKLFLKCQQHKAYCKHLTDLVIIDHRGY